MLVIVLEKPESRQRMRVIFDRRTWWSSRVRGGDIPAGTAHTRHRGEREGMGDGTLRGPNVDVGTQRRHAGRHGLTVGTAGEPWVHTGDVTSRTGSWLGRPWRVGARVAQRSPWEGLAREGREGLVFCLHRGISDKPSEDTEYKNKSRHDLLCQCLKIISGPFLHPFPAYVMTLFTYKLFIAFIIEWDHLSTMSMFHNNFSAYCVVNIFLHW